MARSPGTQVLWRALQPLDMAVQMYIIFTRSGPPQSWRSYPHGYLPPAHTPGPPTESSQGKGQFPREG
jgi:hypothetical protein